METEQYIQPLRKKAPERRQIRHLLQVMAEVFRERKREILRAATSISLSLDDRKDYRLLRFRCDCGPSLAHYGRPHTSRPGVFQGVLGVLRGGGVTSTLQMEDMETDKGEALADSIKLAIRHLCTPMGRSDLDADLNNHVLNSVTRYMADGGSVVQKAGVCLLHDCMPNIVLISRDPSHTLRIAFKDPLEAEPLFKEQWERLFNRQRALIPDIMNSTSWQQKLMACQSRTLEHGTQGGDLNKVLRHLRYAPQRFDSYARPIQRY